MGDYFDDPNFAPIILGALAALLMALAVFGLIDMDDSKTNQSTTLPNQVYTPREEESP